MREFRKDRIIDPIPRMDLGRAGFVLKDLALKYYDELEPIVNDLASKCTGGEECKLSFSSGTIIIKLK